MGAASAQPLSLPPAGAPGAAPGSSHRRAPGCGRGRGCRPGLRRPRERQPCSDVPVGPARGAVHLLGPRGREASRVARPGPASPFPAGPRPVPSPSASASAEECGEAGRAARTPGSAPSAVGSAGPRRGSSTSRDRGEGRPILREASVAGTPRRGNGGGTPQLCVDPGSFTSGQNSRPALVSSWGTPRGWI